MKLNTFKAFHESAVAPVIVPVRGQCAADFLSLDTYHEDGDLCWMNVYADEDEFEEDEDSPPSIYADEDTDEVGLIDATNSDDGFDEAAYNAMLLRKANEFIQRDVIGEVRELGLDILDLRATKVVPYNGYMYPYLDFEFTMERDWIETVVEVTETINPRKFQLFLEELSWTNFKSLNDVVGEIYNRRTGGDALGIVMAFLLGKTTVDYWRKDVNEEIREYLTGNTSKDTFMKR